MEPKWKEFEKLITRIEQALAPRGDIVKTNDWITNNLTGRKRQVDASIRYTVGTVPILITIECRKRKDRQDDTWIEQLVTKKQNLGADATIAVASEGISEQAKKNASFYGIEFRQFSEIGQSDILGWLTIKEVVYTFYHPMIESVATAAYVAPGESGGMLHPSVLEQFKKDANTPMFVRQSDRRAFGVNAILDEAIRRGLDLDTGVPPDGTKVRKQVVIKFPKGIFSIDTTNGPRDLAKLTLSVDVHVTSKVVPVSQKGFSYAGPGIPTVYGVEAKTELFGNNVVVSFHKPEGSDVLHVMISKEKSKAPSRNQVKNKQKRKH